MKQRLKTLIEAVRENSELKAKIKKLKKQIGLPWLGCPEGIRTGRCIFHIHAGDEKKN